MIYFVIVFWTLWAAIKGFGLAMTGKFTQREHDQISDLLICMFIVFVFVATLHEVWEVLV